MRPRVAVDTNFLLDLATPTEDSRDALDLLRDRVKNVELVVTPTVLDELDDLAHNDPSAAKRELALKALQSLVRDWAISPLRLTDVGEDIIESVGDKIRLRGIIPYEERNDSYAIAEAALANCDIFVSNDGHIKDADQTQLTALLRECDVSQVVILTSPHGIIRKFGRKRR